MGIYQGILEHYYTDASGQLDRLVISNASRRLLKDDDLRLSGYAHAVHRIETGSRPVSSRRRKHEPRTRFYPIQGDYFVLHYDEVATLNVRYIKLIEQVENAVA